ncbi:hypothetical protein AKJ16_DCAP13736 [Drosera capensis]
MYRNVFYSARLVVIFVLVWKWRVSYYASWLFASIECMQNVKERMAAADLDYMAVVVDLYPRDALLSFSCHLVPMSRDDYCNSSHGLPFVFFDGVGSENLSRRKRFLVTQLLIMAGRGRRKKKSCQGSAANSGSKK